MDAEVEFGGIASGLGDLEDPGTGEHEAGGGGVAAAEGVERGEVCGRSRGAG